MQQTMTAQLNNKNSKSCTQGFKRTCLLILALCGLMLASTTQAAIDPIFKNSFEQNEINAIVFITPNSSQVVDQDSLQVRVRVSTALGTLQSVSIQAISAQVVSQETDFAEFSAQIPLTLGDNTLVATAHYSDQDSSLQRLVRYIPLPEISITSPTDWQTLGGVGGAGGALDQSGNVQRPVTITGVLNSMANIVDVQINQQQADFDNSSFSFNDFFLHEGSNLINVTALDQYDRQASSQITVYVDQSAPFLSVEGLNNRITSANQIDITGIVNDAIQADFNAPEVTVTISNAANGISQAAQVQDIHYFAADFPLAVGNNPLLITAADAYGNSRDITASVVRIAVGSNRITRFTGNKQAGLVNSQLPQALIINAMDREGLPLVDLPVYFDISKGTGSISSQANSTDLSDGINPARNLIINTNDAGQAQVWLTLGAQSGLGNVQVRAYTPSQAEDVYFTETTLPNDPSQVAIEGASGSQYAQTNGQPVDALTVIVSDDNNNPIANQNVLFSIESGAAYFKANSAPNGQLQATDQTIITTTDKRGQASVRPLVGSTSGNIVITAQAQLIDNSLIGKATFNIIALKRLNGPTSLTGIAMDHTGTPLAGIQFSIARTQLTAISGSDGYFEFPSQVPTGKINLYVDGRNVQAQQGSETVEYPALHFETAIIQGQHNQLPHPVYLPPVHIENTSIVGGNQDVTLTLPNFQGFKMIVKANSVTFPDGSTEGELVVNPVNNDRLPMVPPGAGGRFMATGWTLQPSGTRFDPPIEVHIPNTDGLKPGTTIPIVQWDHDMAFFVPMGLGTISEDGSELVTNPGSGITKAGWGGGPPPISPNTGSNEAGCKITSIKKNGKDILWELALRDGVDVEFEVETEGSTCSNDWQYAWEFHDLSIGVTSSNEAMPTHHYSGLEFFDDVGIYLVRVVMTCTQCDPSYLEAFTAVNIYYPVVDIEKDEAHENGWFELHPFDTGQYYQERTNLKVEMKYPEGHPEAGAIISDYSGNAKITEGGATHYYNNEAGASELPKNDFEITGGKGEISIDSVSDEFANSDGPNGWPKDANILIELDDFEFLNLESKDEYEVKQWVTDSEADVGGPNDSQMPDWLEIKLWDKIKVFSGSSGAVGQVFQNINTVKLAEKDKILTGAECGRTPDIESEVNTLYIDYTCQIGGEGENMFRKDTNKALFKSTFYQARISWQAAQRFTTPENATGAEPKNDSDGDGCPEVIVISDNTEADIQASTPIQDGWGISGDDVPPNTNTNPDDVINQIIDLIPWKNHQISKCHYILKQDAEEFMNDHILGK